MYKYGLVVLLFSQFLNAFVTGPSFVNEGEQLIIIGSQLERGKIEPNENKASYQNAYIDIFKLKYIKSIGNVFGLERSNVNIDYSHFNSQKEQIGNTVFYNHDIGEFFTLGLSGDIYHDLDKQLGFYFNITPYKHYDRNKFSNPRIDIFSLGCFTAFNISDNLFFKNLVHYGAGDSKSQNSYLALDTGFGYKLNQLIEKLFTVSGSLFFEADTSERTDKNYDSVFTSSGNQDRIRSFKYGTLLSLDMGITNQVNISVSYLQKLAGYDARSTQVYSLNFGFKF